jgi:hypothetical protein
MRLAINKSDRMNLWSAAVTVPLIAVGNTVMAVRRRGGASDETDIPNAGTVNRRFSRIRGLITMVLFGAAVALTTGFSASGIAALRRRPFEQPGTVFQAPLISEPTDPHRPTSPPQQSPPSAAAARRIPPWSLENAPVLDRRRLTYARCQRSLLATYILDRTDALRVLASTGDRIEIVSALLAEVVERTATRTRSECAQGSSGSGCDVGLEPRERPPLLSLSPMSVLVLGEPWQVVAQVSAAQRLKWTWALFAALPSRVDLHDFYDQDVASDIVAAALTGYGATPETAPEMLKSSPVASAFPAVFLSSLCANSPGEGERWSYARNAARLRRVGFLRVSESVPDAGSGGYDVAVVGCTRTPYDLARRLTRARAAASHILATCVSDLSARGESSWPSDPSVAWARAKDGEPECDTDACVADRFTERFATSWATRWRSSASVSESELRRGRAVQLPSTRMHLLARSIDDESSAPLTSLARKDQLPQSVFHHANRVLHLIASGPPRGAVTSRDPALRAAASGTLLRKSNPASLCQFVMKAALGCAIFGNCADICHQHSASGATGETSALRLQGWFLDVVALPFNVTVLDGLSQIIAGHVEVNGSVTIEALTSAAPRFRVHTLGQEMTPDDAKRGPEPRIAWHAFVLLNDAMHGASSLLVLGCDASALVLATYHQFMRHIKVGVLPTGDSCSSREAMDFMSVVLNGSAVRGEPVADVTVISADDASPPRRYGLAVGSQATLRLLSRSSKLKARMAADLVVAFDAGRGRATDKPLPTVLSDYAEVSGSIAAGGGLAIFRRLPNAPQVPSIDDFEM